MTSTSWVPLFQGADAGPYAHAIDDIVVSLDENAVMPFDWGPALLHGYLGIAQSSPQHIAQAETLTNRAVESAAQYRLAPGLFGGIAGVGWLSAHIDRLLARDSGDSYDELDDGLVSFVASPLRGTYDLIGGIVGIGLYFIERLPDPKAVEGLRRIAQTLADAAELSAQEASWFTPADILPEWQRQFAPGGYHNLGVAHGVPGIVGLLGEIQRSGIDLPGVDALTSQAVHWLLQKQLAGGGFPSWIAAGVEPTRARVSWCYGELGLSLALLLAARAMADSDMERAALDIAHKAASRRETVAIKDAAMCHGAAGNGHLFNRLYQATRGTEFRDAAIFWFETALRMRVKGTGVGGYRAWKPVDGKETIGQDPWQDNHSFLEGASGIALAFLSAITPTEPNWDRVLLARIDPVTSAAPSRD